MFWWWEINVKEILGDNMLEVHYSTLCCNELQYIYYVIEIFSKTLLFSDIMSALRPMDDSVYIKYTSFVLTIKDTRFIAGSAWRWSWVHNIVCLYLISYVYTHCSRCAKRENIRFISGPENCNRCEIFFRIPLPKGSRPHNANTVNALVTQKVRSFDMIHTTSFRCLSIRIYHAIGS